MNTKTLGWGLLIGGTVLQAAESTAQSSATLNNTLFASTTIGAIVTPIEKFTPMPLGWCLLLLGGAILAFN